MLQKSITICMAASRKKFFLPELKGIETVTLKHYNYKLILVTKRERPSEILAKNI